jgi:hypothetical protein
VPCKTSRFICNKICCPEDTAYEIFLGHCVCKQCLYSALIVISVFSFLHLFTPIILLFFLVSSDPSYFFPTFCLPKLLHLYIGVKILFDVIINWENSEHDAMDEGSSPPTPSPLLSWWKVFKFGKQPQGLVQSTVSTNRIVREENKRVFRYVNLFSGCLLRYLKAGCLYILTLAVIIFNISW